MQILIADLGGQYTVLIARVLRELGVRSIILPPREAERWLGENRGAVKGIILSGGGASIKELKPYDLAPSLLEANLPIFGICLGMHWIATAFGGAVESITEMRGYGGEEITVRLPDDPLLRRVGSRALVWMNHGDSVTKLPPGFRPTAIGESCPIAAMSSDDGRVFATQFHPEVPETPCGHDIFLAFLEVCGAKRDWRPLDAVRSIRERITDAAGPEGNCVLGFSGGRDSSILAAIAAPVLGERLICLTINTGALPRGEMQRTARKAALIGCRHVTVDASQSFIEAVAVAGLDGETKRRAFRSRYVESLESIAELYNAKRLLQGTVLSDIIESGLRGRAERIVLHHNPDLDTWLLQSNPFKDLFKDEVQELGRALGLPAEIVDAEPFPGLGYFIRILGAAVTPQLLGLISWADDAVRETLAEAGFGRPFSQLVVAVLAIPLGGEKGDRQRNGFAIFIRPVQSTTFMTARPYRFPPWLEDRLIYRLTQHPDVVRVFFDYTPKPTARIEYQ